MHDIPQLIDGYRRFLSGRFAAEAATYQALAETGQNPHTMVISCCDSRVHPATIFDVGPGELFVVRNVANLVPPYDPDRDYQGTGAAIQFAVEGLGVDNILVMGHAKCGGIKAFREGLSNGPAHNSLIDRWMSLLNPARQIAIDSSRNLSEAEQQRTMEFAAVRLSLENLRSFPFVDRCLAEGSLRLRGGYFDISNGIVMGLDPASGDFRNLL